MQKTISRASYVAPRILEFFRTLRSSKREVDIQIEQLREEIVKYCRDCEIKEINSTTLRYFNFSFCTALDWQTIFDVIKSLDAERHKIELKEKRYLEDKRRDWGEFTTQKRYLKLT